MLPRYTAVEENIELVKRKCADPFICQQIIQEIEKCLAGAYYSDELLETACKMKAQSINLWYHTLSSKFIEKAHARGLQVLTYTVNKPSELLQLMELGVDGIFTDNFALAANLFISK